MPDYDDYDEYHVNHGIHHKWIINVVADNVK